MTVEEALFVLEHGSAEGLTEYLKAISVIKEHIKELEEKQLPKKPKFGCIDTKRNPSGLYCPNCGWGGITYTHKNNVFVLSTETEYCFNCGQALDWGDDDVC